MAKKEVEDLTGRTFGRWTVLSRAGDRHGKKEIMRYWHCICTCGSNIERDIYERSLRKGTSNSCGCLIEEKRIARLQSMIGKKYNHWTVIDIAPTRRSPGGKLISYLLCECDCEKHTIREVAEKALINDQSQSCGCYQLKVLRQTQRNSVEDISGKKYNCLTAIYYDDSYVNYNGKLKSVWWCKCDCGNQNLIPVTRNQLITGKTQSCGHIAREKTIERNKLRKEKNQYDLSGEYGIGWTNKGEPFYFDLEDYNIIKDYNWKYTKDQTTSTQYVQAHHYDDFHQFRTTIRLNRLVMNCFDNNLEVDHINRINYDARKSNLRICTRSENQHNKNKSILNVSGIPGVNIEKSTNKYRVRIGCNGIRYNLGLYEDFSQAALIRLIKEKELFGEFMPEEHNKLLQYLKNGGKLEYGNKELIDKIIFE